MKNKGFTLFVAMIVMGTLLLIATGIVSLAIRQALTSASGRESQYAFYAADTGIECALFWDVQNPLGSSFSTSTGSTIYCNDPSSSNPLNVGGSSVSTFSFNLDPDPYCVTVTINKRYDPFPTDPTSVLKTTIESKGYNTCDSSNPRRVERAVRAVY
jgi:Tfp pilus assembly protein PilX